MHSDVSKSDLLLLDSKYSPPNKTFGVSTLPAAVLRFRVDFLAYFWAQLTFLPEMASIGTEFRYCRVYQVLQLSLRGARFMTMAEGTLERASKKIACRTRSQRSAPVLQVVATKRFRFRPHTVAKASTPY
jgi:hypothetical protein